MLIYLQNLLKKVGDKVLIRNLKENPPYHFWVGDSRNIRLEHPHPYKKVAKVTGKIRYNTLHLGWKYSDIHNKKWRESLDLQPVVLP